MTSSDNMLAYLDCHVSADQQHDRYTLSGPGTVTNLRYIVFRHMQVHRRERGRCSQAETIRVLRQAIVSWPEQPAVTFGLWLPWPDLEHVGVGSLLSRSGSRCAGFK